MVRARPLLLLVVLAVALSGCYRSDTSIEVNDDGSGTFTMIAAIDREAFGQLGGLGMLEDESGDAVDENADPCEQVQADADSSADELPPGTTVEAYEDGNFCGVTISTEFSS